MKKNWHSIILGLFVASGIAWGAFSEFDKALMPQRNLLLNPGAEGGKAGWTANNTTFAASTSSPIEGNASFTWDAGNTAATFTSTAVAIPAGWYGQNGVGGCYFNCATSTCTHTLTATNGTSTFATATISTAATGSIANYLNFIYPTTGNIHFKLLLARNT